MGEYSKLSKYKGLPKKSARRYLDELWSKIIHIKDGERCIVCSSKKTAVEQKHARSQYLNSHHLISRKVLKYRWDTCNGVLLCPNCHRFSPIFSAHNAPWAFDEWMKINRPEQYGYWVAARNNITFGEKQDLEEKYQQLEEEYKVLTGSYYRPERCLSYYIHNNIDKIKETLEVFSVKDASKKIGVSKKTLYKIIDNNNILNIKKDGISKEALQKMKTIFCKPVVQLNNNGEFIKSYFGIAPAADELGISRSSINNALHDRVKRAGGFLWIYETRWKEIKNDAEKINEFVLSKRRSKTGPKP